MNNRRILKIVTIALVVIMLLVGCESSNTMARSPKDKLSMHFIDVG